MKQSKLEKILGGKPINIFMKLLVSSFIVGVVLSIFNWEPRDLLAKIGVLFYSFFGFAFQSASTLFNTFLNGLIIVIPIFLLSRFFSDKR